MLNQVSFALLFFFIIERLNTILNKTALSQVLNNIKLQIKIKYLSKDTYKNLLNFDKFNFYFTKDLELFLG